MTGFTLEAVTHRALGPLRRLVIGCAACWDFTHQEALILSRALAAVRDGRSAEKTIFMSPIASDAEFTATVVEDGVMIGDEHLAWDAVETLAATLGEA